MGNKEKVLNILEQMENVANHPAQAIRQWKKETGGKAVGCLPVHSGGAEEIIDALGMLPVGLWGGQTAISRASQYLQAFCCSIMKAVMEFALVGVYKDIDAVISPNTCDTMRCIPLMIKEGVPDLPVIGLVYPDNRKIEVGVEYLAEEYRQVADQLEKIAGKKLEEAALTKSIETYNQHRKLMTSFFDMVGEHLDIITPYYRHMVVKSSFFMPRVKHIELLEQLIAELQQLPVADWDGFRVITTGIIAEPYSVLKLFEEFGLAIVGDEMAYGSRQFRVLVPDGNNPFERLAQRFADFEGCSTVHDPAKLRGTIIKDMVEKHKADGVVVLLMKFCDPEEYDYPYIKKDLDDAGIPSLYVEIEQQMESLEQVRTRLQAFKEILAQGK